MAYLSPLLQRSLELGVLLLLNSLYDLLAPSIILHVANVCEVARLGMDHLLQETSYDTNMLSTYAGTKDSCLLLKHLLYIA